MAASGEMYSCQTLGVMLDGENMVSKRYIFSCLRGALVLGLAHFSMGANAGIPVLDQTNLTQTTVSALQNVAAVLKQVQQYQTQLQQYQSELQNSIAPSAYVWSRASQTITSLLAAQDTLSYYKRQAGSLDSYLARYQDVSYYRTSPCFTSAGCSVAQQQSVQGQNALGSEAEKRANDALLKSIDQQQSTLSTDATNLADLQSQASGASGRMQAIQAGNQLASAQANQLLQIRALLSAQQNALATRAQVVTDREAQQAAADQQALSGVNTPSPARTW